MLITVKDENKKIFVKDILDIDFDMSVDEKDNKYYVNVNKKYQLPEVFENEEDAVEQMLKIATIRNGLENELRNELRNY